MIDALARSWIAVSIAASLLASQGARAKTASALPSDGGSVAGHITGGEPVTYAVRLAAGDFIHVLIEQQGVDVALRFLDPLDQSVVEADSINGTHGLERVAFVAKRAGEHRLVVTAATTGAYTVTVAALRQPTPRDLTVVSAEEVFNSAERSRAANTAASRPEARTGFRRAAELFGAAGRPYETALAHFSEGSVDLASSDPRAAIDALSMALAIAERIDQPLRASALNALGGAHDLLGNATDAMRCYELALKLVPDGDAELRAVLANNIGKLYYDTADWQRSLEYYRRALDAFTAAHNTRRQGLTTHNLGVVYARLGDTATAADYYNRALTLNRAASNTPFEATTLTAQGGLYRDLGEFDRALAAYDQALRLRRSVGDRRAEATTLAAIADVQSALGRIDEATPLFDQALALERAAGDKRNEARTLSMLAGASRATPARAGNVAREALAIFRALGDRQNAAATLTTAARAARDLGQFDTALRDVEEALAANEDVRSRVTSDDLRASFLSGRNEAYLLAIDVLMALDAREPAAGHAARALETSERGRARSLLDLLTASGARVRQGVDQSLVDREQRLSQDINAKAARLMSAAGLERDTLGREIQALETEYSEVQASIRRTSPAYAALTQPRPLTAAEIQRDVLDDNTVLLEYSLGDTASYLWTVNRDTLTTHRLSAASVINDAVQDVRRLITTRPATPTAGPRLRRAIARLSDLVVAPLGSSIAGKRLAIVADGALEYVPFAILAAPDAPSEPLVAAHEIVMLPSASSLAVVRAQAHERDRPTRGIAVLADPVFQAAAGRAAPSPARTSGDDEARLFVHEGGAAGTPAAIPRLPFTRAEARSVLQSAGTGDHFEAFGFDATKDLVLGGRLRDYRFVHFATHGYVDAERPQLSSIVLSTVDRSGKARDGFLRAHELYNLELRSDLVVLSACETGLGKLIKGEGLVGLTRGFMYAGAPRVAVSLWSVSDRATAALMGRFYQSMLQQGQTPAAALRAAQLAMLKQPAWQHPYFWAPFVLQGDWR